MRTKIISIYNNKGGVGKTTTTKRLAVELKNQGKKILILDMDPQANITYQILEVNTDYELNTYALLLSDSTLDELIIKGSFGIDIVPSSIKLLEANNEMLMQAFIKAPNSRLENKLKQSETDYDYILIDCPPTMDLLVANALTVTDDVIIPINCDNYSIQGIEMLITKITQIKDEFNPKLELKGIFLNRYKNSNVHKELLIKLAHALPDVFCQTYIGDYAIINADTFENQTTKIDNHKVSVQFSKLFKEMGVM
ncbi:MAG: ParA family protein [Mycoplasmatales bacterium]